MSDISRKEFLIGAGVGAALVLNPEPAVLAAGAVAGALPQRALGKTGVQVPILGFGTAPAGERITISEAVKLYEEAMSLGIRYFDTATPHSGYGKAQEQLGVAMQGRRKDAFLVTKCWDAKGEDALKSLKQSLKELKTDHVDLVLAHSVGSDKMPLETVMGRGGIMEALYKARRDGLTKYIGISGHNRPGRFLNIIAKHDIDVMLNAVNLVDRHTYGFEQKVWPLAAKKRIGLVAMKVFGGQYGTALTSSRLPVEMHALSFRYALSQLGVSCAIIGMATSEELKRNVEWAKSFTPLTAAELATAKEAGRDLATKWGAHFGAVV